MKCKLFLFLPLFVLESAAPALAGSRTAEPHMGQLDEDWLCGLTPQHSSGNHMKIKLASVFVEDQEKALKFYTEVLGFVKKTDVPAGEYRWLTVVSPDGPNDLELLLEPDANPAAKTFQRALLDQGIPATAFFVDDIQKEYERLTAAGVTFIQTPVEAGPVTIATFNDTCGNLIQLIQQ